jgi:hypothetical protein
MKLGNPLEFVLISLLLYLVLFFSIHTVALPEDNKWESLSGLSFYKYLLNAWTGQLRLWLVFWPFFIVLNLSLYEVDNLAKQGSFTVSSWDEIHFILFTPVIFWTISVWRNSVNSGSRFWAAGARFLTVAVFFEYGLKLIIRRDYPRIFFGCKDIILDYAACF